MQIHWAPLQPALHWKKGKWKI